MACPLSDMPFARFRIDHTSNVYQNSARWLVVGGWIVMRQPATRYYYCLFAVLAGKNNVTKLEIGCGGWGRGDKSGYNMLVISHKWLQVWEKDEPEQMPG